jgi:hypothetical protein
MCWVFYCAPQTSELEQSYRCTIIIIIILLMDISNEYPNVYIEMRQNLFQI